MTIEQFLTRAAWLARPPSPSLGPARRPQTAARLTRHAARGRPLTSPRCHRPRPTCHDVACGAPLARPATPPADGPLTSLRPQASSDRHTSREERPAAARASLRRDHPAESYL